MNLSPEQQKARDTVHAAVVVSASAGAGKTRVLIERLLKRCIDDRVPITSILALTFTKAAAQEMKSRLSAGLSERQKEAEKSGNREEAAYIRKQLIDLSAASITTIDSWCLDIIRKYCSVIGKDPAVTTHVLDGGSADLLRHQAFTEELQNFSEEDRDSAVQLASSFSSRPEDFSSLEDAVFTIITNASSSVSPEQWYEKAAQMYEPVRSIHELNPVLRRGFFSTLIRQMQGLRQDLAVMRMHIDEAKLKKNTDPEQEILLAMKRVDNAIAHLENEEYEGWRSYLINELSVRMPPTGEEDSVYDAVRSHYMGSVRSIRERAWSEESLTADQKPLAKTVSELLHLAQNVSHRFAGLKEEQSAMDFSDMERWTLEILDSGNGETAARIRSSYQEIMVDEFQDTSVLQNEIITRISKSDNTFRVGDVKQSIYRFRQARPALMRSMMADSETTTVVLHQNYRSKESIVTFSNILFNRLMNIEGFSDTYSEQDTVSCGSPSQLQDTPDPVIMALLPGKKGSEAEGEEAENPDAAMAKADWIAEEILRRHASGQYGFHDFAVLVHSHQTKLILKQAFDHYNIPYDIDTRSGFYNSVLCMEIRAMVNLMLDHNDAISLMCVLTSGFYSWSDETVAKKTAASSSHNLCDMIQKENPEIYEEMDELAAIARRRGLGAMLREISSRHDYYNHLPSRQKANFDFLYDKTTAGDIHDLYGLLELMKANGDERSSEAVTRGDNDAVTVTTIHQSKGLQYNVVFLWSESRNPFHEDTSPLMIHDDLMIGLKYTDPVRMIQKPSIQSIAVRDACSREDLEEYIRLLYVALTRPVEKLIIVDTAPEEKNISRSVSAASASTRRGMTDLILSAMDEGPYFHIDNVTVQDLPPYEGETSESIRELPRFQKEDIHFLPAVMTPSSTEQTTVAPLSLTENKKGREYGTALHAAMEHLPDTLWTAEDLQKTGLPLSMQKKIQAFGESSLYQKCLNMEIHREFPFFVIDPQNSRTLTGSMDFMAIGPTDIILIDYKTDNDSPESIASKYADQIHTYAEALHLMYPDHVIHAWIWSFHHDLAIDMNGSSH